MSLAGKRRRNNYPSFVECLQAGPREAVRSRALAVQTEGFVGSGRRWSLFTRTSVDVSGTEGLEAGTIVAGCGKDVAGAC